MSNEWRPSTHTQPPAAARPSSAGWASTRRCRRRRSAWPRASNSKVDDALPLRRSVVTHRLPAESTKWDELRSPGSCPSASTFPVLGSTSLMVHCSGERREGVRT